MTCGCGCNCGQGPERFAWRDLLPALLVLVLAAAIVAGGCVELRQAAGQEWTGPGEIVVTDDVEMFGGTP